MLLYTDTVKKLSFNYGQCAKVSMARVSQHCNQPPYLALVRKAIKNGGGFVQVFAVNTDNDTATVSGNAMDYMLGGVEVPLDSLIF